MADASTPSPSAETKKPVSLAVNGKSFLKLHASPREVLRLLKSLPSSKGDDAQLDDWLEALPATSYEEGLGKDFKDLERSLAEGPPKRMDGAIEEKPSEEVTDDAAAENAAAAGVETADDVSVKSAKSTRSLSSLKARALRKLSRKAKKGKKVAASNESAKSSKSVAGDDASDKSAVSSKSKATKEEETAEDAEERALTSKVTLEDDEIEVEKAVSAVGEEPTAEEPQVEDASAKETTPLLPIQEDVNMEPNIEVVRSPSGDRDAIGFCNPEPEEKEEAWGADLGAAAYDLSLMIDGAVVQSLTLGSQAMEKLFSWAQPPAESVAPMDEAKEGEEIDEPAVEPTEEVSEESNEEEDEAESTSRKAHCEVDDVGKILSVTPNSVSFEDAKVADVDVEDQEDTTSVVTQAIESSLTVTTEVNDDHPAIEPVDSLLSCASTLSAQTNGSAVSKSSLRTAGSIKKNLSVSFADEVEKEDVNMEPNVEVVGLPDRDAIGFSVPEPKSEEEEEEESVLTESEPIEETSQIWLKMQKISSIFGNTEGSATKEVAEDRNDANGDEESPVADADETREVDGCSLVRDCPRSRRLRGGEDVEGSDRSQDKEDLLVQQTDEGDFLDPARGCGGLK